MMNKRLLKKLGVVFMVGFLVIVLAACETSGILDELPGDDNGDELAIINIDYDTPDDLEFDLGTSEAEIIAELPGQVTVTFNDGDTEEYDFDWDAPTDFDPEVEGEYTFTGTFEVPGFDVDPIEVDVEIVDITVIEVSENINEATTWESQYVYRVLDYIDVNANFTIEPGTRVEFAEEAGFELTSGNIIKAGDPDQVGTLNNEDQIVFTAVDQVLGWKGIVIDSSDPRNAMDNVLIEHVKAGNPAPPALRVAGGSDDGAHLTLTNSRIENNSNFGLVLEGRGTTFTDSANNVYSNNGIPVYLTDNNMKLMDSESDFTGNNADYILVDEGHSTRDVFGDQLIRPLNVPYRIEDEFRFADGKIEIIGGVEFEFVEGAGFRFEDESQVKVGIPDPDEEGREVVDQVVFTADIAQAGQEGRWNGIRIESSHPDNLIQNTLIDYGGNSDNEDAALFIQEDAYVRVMNSTISNSGADGIFLRRNASDIDMNGVTITNNKGAPVRLRPDNIQNLSSNNNFTGNDKDYIDITSPGHDTDLYSNQTWQALDVPYRFDLSISVDDDLELEIQAGTELQFRNGRKMDVEENAKLTAIGTESDPIIFTSADDTSSWDGLMIRTDRDNKLKHVVIEDGGDSNNTAHNDAANLEVGGGSSGTATVQLENAEINNSSNIGIYVRVRNGSTINGYDNAADFGANYDSYNISFNNNENGNYEFDD